MARLAFYCSVDLKILLSLELVGHCSSVEYLRFSGVLRCSCLASEFCWMKYRDI